MTFDAKAGRSRWCRCGANVNGQPGDHRSESEPRRCRNAVSRSGLGLLGTVGLGELAADSPEQYVSIALALAGDLARLERLRASLRSREELLQCAWQQYRTHTA